MIEKVWILWFEAPSSDVISYVPTQLISGHKTHELAVKAMAKKRMGYSQGSLYITKLMVEVDNEEDSL